MQMGTGRCGCFLLSRKHFECHQIIIWHALNRKSHWESKLGAYGTILKNNQNNGKGIKIKFYFLYM